MMAAGDYRSCDVCGGKAFYDANLNYETGDKIDGKWVYPETPYKIAGVHDSCDVVAVGYVGDWAVICTECAKTHRTAILPLLPDNAMYPARPCNIKRQSDQGNKPPGLE